MTKETQVLFEHYLQLRKEYDKLRGTPNCNRLKKQYQETAAQLFPLLPWTFEFGGFVVKKHLLKIAGREIPTLMLYTPASYARAKEFLDSRPSPR